MSHLTWLMIVYYLDGEWPRQTEIANSKTMEVGAECCLILKEGWLILSPSIKIPLQTALWSRSPLETVKWERTRPSPGDWLCSSQKTDLDQLRSATGEGRIHPDISVIQNRPCSVREEEKQTGFWSICSIPICVSGIHRPWVQESRSFPKSCFRKHTHSFSVCLFVSLSLISLSFFSSFFNWH